MTFYPAGILLLALLSGPSRTAHPDDGMTVRLAVCTDLKQVVVGGQDLRMLDGDLHDILAEGIEGNRQVRASREGIEIPGVGIKPRSLFVSANGPVRVGERLLVGRVEIRATRRGQLMVINHLPLERYLEGILGAEMSSSWHAEALRAQAVASRTFAVRRRLDRESEAYDLSVTTLDQVYKGIGREARSTREAVCATRGEVLTFRGLPAEALFHSCCGGKTRSAREIFGNPVPYLLPAEDPNCARCPRANWEITIALDDVAAALIRDGRWQGPVKEVVLVDVAGEPQVEVAGSGKRRLRLNRYRFRQLMGPQVLPSTDYKIRTQGVSLLLRGHGAGHGVGMCQWGARGMAEAGYDYTKILRRFYPGCELRKMY